MSDTKALPDPEYNPLDLLTTREERFVRQYLSDGLFDNAKAVEVSYPKCPPEKRSAYAWTLRKRPKVREAIRFICAQSMETLKDRLEYTLGRALMLQAFFNPFDIIDANKDGTLSFQEALQFVKQVAPGF